MKHRKNSAASYLSWTRRRMLKSMGLAGTLAWMTGGRVLAAPPPKEAGLSFEGLLKGKPGFQPRNPAPQPFPEIPGFLSKRQIAHNYEVYRAAFADLLAAEQALQELARNNEKDGEYLELRSRQLNGANAVLLHEFYFGNLAIATSAPNRYVRNNMTEHMGSLETWMEDFTACGRVAGSWAVLSYDPYDDRWHNLPLDDSNAGGMAGANPLVVCDVSDDAWNIDYGNRETYLAEFLKHLDWDEVASRYRAVDRK